VHAERNKVFTRLLIQVGRVPLCDRQFWGDGNSAEIDKVWGLLGLAESHLAIVDYLELLVEGQ
jgi:hypothetical protein